jgi:predicted ferric reductase
VALIILVVLAFLRDRLPVSYEAWRGAHGALALVAVAGGLHHAMTAGTYAAEPGPRLFWIAAAMVVALAVAILYGWRWWALNRYPWVLTSVRPVGKAMWELELDPAPGTPPLAYRAGQFVWMSVAPRLFPLFDHPFSLASAPRRPGIALVIKELGDFTRTVGSIPAGTRIGIDGPHGDFTAEGRSAGALLLVAGGVGIAPILGILRDLVDHRDPRPVRLVYGAGSPEKLVARDEINAATDVIDLKASLVVEEGGEDWAGMLGAIDHADLEAALSGLDRSDTLALICGPDLMMSAVADNLLRLGLPEHNVVYERFVYGETPPSRRDRRRQAYFAAIGLALAVAVLAFAWR